MLNSDIKNAWEIKMENKKQDLTKFQREYYSCLRPEIKYIAMDSNGWVCAYTHLPVRYLYDDTKGIEGGGYWHSGSSAGACYWHLSDVVAYANLSIACRDKLFPFSWKDEPLCLADYDLRVVEDSCKITVLNLSNKEFTNKAHDIVMNYVLEHCDKSDNVTLYNEDVYIVWSCKTLQNHKALLSTNLHDGMYYEVTYNGDKGEIYLDAYKKFENKCIKIND